MTVEENKALVGRLVAEALNTGDEAALSRFFAGAALEEYTATFQSLMSAFPGLYLTTNELIGEANMVAGRFTFSATHSGPWQGMAPTGRTLSFEAIRIFQIENGRIVRSVAYSDTAGIMRQLNAS